MMDRPSRDDDDGSTTTTIPHSGTDASADEEMPDRETSPPQSPSPEEGAKEAHSAPASPKAPSPSKEDVEMTDDQGVGEPAGPPSSPKTAEKSAVGGGAATPPPPAQGEGRPVQGYWRSENNFPNCDRLEDPFF